MKHTDTENPFPSNRLHLVFGQENILAAKRRVVLASLYLGTGEKERKLVELLDECLQQRIADQQHSSSSSSSKVNCKDGLQVQILIDRTRGTRSSTRGVPHNSASLLAPLVAKYPDNVSVALYQSPRLHNPLLAMLLKPPMNEVVELTHMKIYLADDRLILSGANLSEDYFDQRQDRYVQFVDGKFGDFCQGLVELVSRYSWSMQADGSHAAPPLYSDQAAFYAAAKEDVTAYLADACSSAAASAAAAVAALGTAANTKRPKALDLGKDENHNGHDNVVSATASGSAEEREGGGGVAAGGGLGGESPAPAPASSTAWVYPLVQMGPWGVRHDEEITAELLSSFEQGTKVFLATGYFNLTKVYTKAILESAASVDVLTASPRANGFFNANGIKSSVPSVYTLVEQRFLKQVEGMGLGEKIRVHEYARDGWTYHAKGMWAYPPPTRSSGSGSGGRSEGDGGGRCSGSSDGNNRGSGIIEGGGGGGGEGASAGNSNFPALTFVGSPNFGVRSSERDLECQAAVVTDDRGLAERLHHERGLLYARGEPVSTATFNEESRKIKWWETIFGSALAGFF